MWKTSIELSSGTVITSIEGQFFPPQGSHIVFDTKVYEVKKFVSIPKMFLIIMEVNNIL